MGLFFIICLMCSGLYGTLMFAMGPGFFVLAVILASMTAIPYGALLLWLDRNEPEPPSLIATAFLWGACVSTMMSLVLNESFGGVALSMVQDEAVAGQLTASIAAPLFEELTKGAAVVLLFALFRDEFDNVLDGIIYGAIIGLGFAWYENILYYMNASADGGVAGMLTLAWVRGVVSASGGSHAAYTAIVGCAFGLVRVMRRGVLRWALVPLFWGTAMFAHFAWNTFTQIILNLIAPGNALGQLFIGLPLAVLVLQLPFTVLLLGTVVFSWRHENRIIREYLSDSEVDIITDEERGALVPASRRTLHSAARFFTKGPGQWWQHRRLARRQIDLAFLKWHHIQDGIAWHPDQDKDILRIRADIRRIRARLR